MSALLRTEFSPHSPGGQQSTHGGREEGEAFRPLEEKSSTKMSTFVLIAFFSQCGGTILSYTQVGKTQNTAKNRSSCKT